MRIRKNPSEWHSGVLFALALLHIHGSEVEAGEIVAECGGLKEMAKGIAAEQDQGTYEWLKGFCQ